MPDLMVVILGQNSKFEKKSAWDLVIVIVIAINGNGGKMVGSLK